MENHIHSSAIIGPNVTLGRNNYIGPYCVLSGVIEIGDDNFLSSHVCIGSPPQHRGFIIDTSILDSIGTIKIGSSNSFHEFVTIHQPFHDNTIVGSNCFVMSYAHVSHDTQLEDGVTLANNVQIGGHSIIMKGATVGFSTAIHQCSVIGSYVMLGMGSLVSRSIAPFAKYAGIGPIRIGTNEVGLKRIGITEEEIASIEVWGKSYLKGNSSCNLSPYLMEEVTRYEMYVKKTSHG